MRILSYNWPGVTLRTVHLIFISACVLLALGAGAWAMGQYRARQDAAYAFGGIGSLAAAAGLAVYAARFRRRSRRW